MKLKSLMILFGCLLVNVAMSASGTGTGSILSQVFKYDKSTKALVNIDEIKQGCRARDCIPAIDKPQFASIKQTNILHDSDTVMLVDYNGVKKAYPLKIMQGHEIVNDHFNGKP